MRGSARRRLALALTTPASLAAVAVLLLAAAACQNSNGVTAPTTVTVTTSGATAHLSLAYYFSPNTSCTASTCQLNVGGISSANGGTSWGPATRLTPSPMAVTSLANTNQGYMVGDYISASFAGAKATAVFAVATTPGASLGEPMAAAPLP